MEKSKKYTRDDILRKAKAMIDHAESAKEIGNLKEAEAFSNKLSKFLQKHNLEMAEAEGFEQKREDDITENSQVVVDEKAQYGRWEQNLLDTLCQYNYCKMLLCGRKTKNGQGTIIIGTSENIQIVKYLHSFLSKTLLPMGVNHYSEKRRELRIKYGAYAKSKVDAIPKIADHFDFLYPRSFEGNVVKLKNSLADQEKLDQGLRLYGVQEFGKLPDFVAPMGYKPKFVESYLNGAVRGIGDKLEAEMKDLQPEIKKKAGALIKVNDKAIDKYLDKEFPNLGKRAMRRRKVNNGAYRKGKKDGRNVAIRKGVDAGTTGQKSLNS